MGSSKLVYIRTDGNSHIATGHLMRTLSIARACAQKELSVSFIVSDLESKELLQRFLIQEALFPALFPIIVLEELTQLTPDSPCISYSEPEQELSVFCTLLQEAKPSLLLIDSYFITPEYVNTLSSYTRLAYLDDLRKYDYAIDLIVNYDVIPDTQLGSYQASYKNAQQCLLGATYTPLRSQFQNLSYSLSSDVHNILITTGGSDEYNVALHVLQEFIIELSGSDTSSSTLKKQYEAHALHFHIVVGSLNTHKNQLEAFCKKYDFVHLHEHVADMAALMCSCDLSISAAGTMLYELCAVGLPAISYCIADNQIPAATAFHQVGAIPCTGDVRTDSSIYHELVHAALDLGDSYEKRCSHSAAMRKLVDGKGSERIACAIDKIITTA